MRRYLNTLGTGVQPPRAAEFTVRQVCQWTLRRPDRLEQEDREHLQAICARCPTLATATRLAQGFARLLRERRGVQQLVAWVAEVEASDIPELHAFAAGLRKDWAAVTASSTLPWSSGAVEGHVNRIKELSAAVAEGVRPPGEPDVRRHRRGVISDGRWPTADTAPTASYTLPTSTCPYTSGNPEAGGGIVQSMGGESVHHVLLNWSGAPGVWLSQANR